jgi:hypothetical protein
MSALSQIVGWEPLVAAGEADGLGLVFGIGGSERDSGGGPER